ncbi:MAG TPA: HEAT repeat domain-containing protein, partial [Kofleriaceae bacterium]|nr:HEAT repeat domain-containing protein [Kofleriaceae bacterium]
MTRRFSWLPMIVGLLVLAGLTGCPDDPYKADTWTKKLGESREAEQAVTKLEELGDPSAIGALGQAWVAQGKPVRLLQVIISLARPLTVEDAKKKFVTDYEATGRAANWDKALPFLKQALSEVDEANPRSVDSATKAADALGEAKLPDGLDALIEFAQKPMTKKLVTAQVAAVRAIGKYTEESAKAASALTKLVDRDPPPHPRTAKDKDQGRALEEKYSMFVGLTGAAINALGDLHVASSAKTLVLAMFRTPDLFLQIRRALVASGPVAADELRKVLAGTHPEVNQLFKDKKLDKYCGDKN